MPHSWFNSLTLDKFLQAKRAGWSTHIKWTSQHFIWNVWITATRLREQPHTCMQLQYSYLTSACDLVCKNDGKCSTLKFPSITQIWISRPSFYSVETINTTRWIENLSHSNRAAQLTQTLFSSGQKSLSAAHSPALFAELHPARSTKRIAPGCTLQVIRLPQFRFSTSEIIWTITDIRSWT